MKTLYIECKMGAAGDMLTAALLELLPDPDAFVEELNQLGIPGVKYEKEASVKCGITGTHMKVTICGQEEESHDIHGHDHGHDHDHDSEYEHTQAHEHTHDQVSDYTQAHEHTHDYEHGYDHDHEHITSHSHTSLHGIEHVIRDHLKLSPQIQKDVMAVYTLIAEAESKAHGKPIDEIHFHEVGTMDAIADVVAVCMLMNKIGADRVVVSPIHVGSGQVRCAHGILPVPAPATAHILQGVPTYGGKILGELCTPTGAALLKHFANQFGDMPVMSVNAMGYGMGKKDFEAANCVRVMLGESEADNPSTDEIYVLSCNLDDMTGEQIGFALEQLLEAGAVDAVSIPIYMKKNRPGVMLQVLCKQEKKEEVVRAIFKHTTTIGIRESIQKRYILNREMKTLETQYGPISCKVSSGYGITRKKYEFEDLRRIAKEQNMSIAELENFLSN